MQIHTKTCYGYNIIISKINVSNENIYMQDWHAQICTNKAN